MEDWRSHAAELAAAVTPRGSRWRQLVADTPRHVFVPRWWKSAGDYDMWELHDGPPDPAAWMRAAYSDESLVTRVGPLHADHAAPEDRPSGSPTSSSTLPSLVVRMLRHGEIYDGADVLDVATGSGYSAALLSQLLGDKHVTSIDVDRYLVEAAAGRLDEIGLHPKVLPVDATGPLPGEYDAIVSMVALRPVPASWLAALRPGGRLVTVIARTALILTATKTPDGEVVGRIEWDRAMFMEARSGEDYPPPVRDRFTAVWDAEGEEVTRGRYPVTRVFYNWELPSMLEIVAPGIEHDYEERDGRRIARMVHADGSWTRAEAEGDEPPIVHQGGPRRLWDILDDIRHRWLLEGELPLRGARAFVQPTGEIGLIRGGWKTVVGAGS